MIPLRPLCAYTDYGLEFLAGRVPGWVPGKSGLYRLDKNVVTAGLPDRVMVAILEQVPHPQCPYIPGVWDCENFSRWYASQAAELWGRLVNRGETQGNLMCLAQGVVTGSIPVANLPYGDHAACFFWNDQNQYRIWEPQTRTLLTPERVRESREVWRLEFH